MKKTLLMSKLFSNTTKGSFKKSFSDAVDQALNEGSAIITTEDGEVLNLVEVGGTVVVEDPANGEATSVEVNPEDSNDLLLSPITEDKTVAESKTGRKFSEGAEAAPIAEGLDGTAAEPEAEIEIIEGEDGKHFSITGKNINSKYSAVVRKFFSELDNEAAPIAEGLDGTAAEPEAKVVVVEGEDGKHFSEAAPEVAVEVVEPAAEAVVDEAISEITNAANELQEKVNELEETRDIDLANEVLGMTNELIKATENVEGTEAVREQCSTYSKLCSEVLGTQEEVAEAEEKTEAYSTPLNQLILGFSASEEAETEDEGGEKPKEDPKPEDGEGSDLEPKAGELGDGVKEETKVKSKIFSHSYKSQDQDTSILGNLISTKF